MPQTKEEIRARHRAYMRTPAGRKSRCIGNWKQRGIICSDYDALYERYLNTTNCQKCDVLLTRGLSRTGKCLDHDHSIDDRENVRGVLCRACNSNDDGRNTSGVPNVSYHKRRDRWVYKLEVNRVAHQKYFKTKEEAICYKYQYELNTKPLLEVPNSTTEVRRLP